MTGRPSKFTTELFDEICERISKGETLASICRDKGIGASTVYDWMAEDKTLAGRFARAREKGFDAIAEQCLDIADDSRSDFVVNGKGDEVFNAEHVQRSKLRVETRLKLLAKWDPKRYGDKLEVGGKLGLSLEQLVQGSMAGQGDEQS